MVDLSPFDYAMGGDQKFSPPPDFDGPVRKRRITDPLCFGLLLLVWGLTAWVGIWAGRNGSTDTLIYPSDYRGRLCGIDEDSDGNTLPSQWHAVDSLSNGICIEGCPTDANLSPSSRSDLFCKDEDDLLGMNACSQNGEISEDIDVLVTCGGCMYAMGTIEMRSKCLPASAESIIEEVNNIAVSQGLDALEDWSSFDREPLIQRFIRDMRTSQTILLTCFGISAALGLMFLLLLRAPACIGPVIWISTVFAPLCLGGAGALVFLKIKDYELDETGIHSDMKVIVLKAFNYTLWALAGVMFLIIAFMSREIMLAISIAKAASRAVREVKFSGVFPILQLLVYAAFLIAMAIVSIRVAGAGTFVEKSDNIYDADISYMEYVYSDGIVYVSLSLIFVFYWTSQYVDALGQIALSHTFTAWYFTPEKDEGNDISMARCTLSALCLHSGTAAFGALLIGVVSIIRSPILFVQRRIKGSGANNCFIDAIICSCQCCFFTLERFLKFTSKDAYIQTALFSYSFCKGSHESFYLLKRNSDRIGKACFVRQFSVTFCKIFMSLLVAMLSFVLLDKNHGDDLYSVTTISVLVGIIGWYIGNFFTEIYGIAVNVMLHCYLADEEMLGNEGSIYVPNELDEFLGKLDNYMYKGKERDYDDETMDKSIQSSFSRETDEDIPNAVMN